MYDFFEVEEEEMIVSITFADIGYSLSFLKCFFPLTTWG